MLQEERQTLGFNPCEGAHMLTAKSDSAKGSAKRVLKKLTGKTSKEEIYERAALCWRETDLDVLEERGAATGLADFIADVREHLLPLFV